MQINGIDVKLASIKKDYLNWTSKPSYISYRTLDNDLVAMCKNKVRLTLNKPAFIGISMLELSKALMHKLVMITLKINMVTTQDFYSQILIV